MAFLFVVIVIPLSVHAGFFSALFSTKASVVEENLAFASEANIQTVPLLKAAVHVDPNPAKGGGDILISDGSLVPSGDIDGEDHTDSSRTNNGEISVYTVREGDTLSQIAEMFDVSAKTILWANDISDPEIIQPGDTLVILPITGVRHVVKSGDTISTIAEKYEGNVDDILAYNQLTSAEEISVGDTIVIPDGTINAPAPTYARPAKTSGSYASNDTGFTHPLPGSVKTQGLHGYNGIDFGAPAGTPILAAASGEVIVSRSSGWNGGYGLYVVVRHPNGTQTLYAHMSSNAASVGQSVRAGQVIGYVGNTGRSTGNHLHFEVRGARNPF